MGSKLPLVGIFAFGIVAALGAAMLTAVFRIKPQSADAGVPKVASVIVAADELPALTKLEESRLEVREVPVGEAPAERISDPVAVLGRVLKVPLVKGQPITEASLMTEEAGARLALSLPDGHRAVSVELSASSAIRGLLYPGCRVDVLASERSISGRSTGVARTLLENVGVLAVDDKTVFDVEEEPAEGEDAAPPTRRVNDQRKLLVTLMVLPDEASLLQAARDRGELSLSLRNPLDESTQRQTQASGEGKDAPAAQRFVNPAEPWRTVIIRGNRSDVQEFDRRGEPVRSGPGGVIVPPSGGGSGSSVPPPPPPTGGSGGEGGGGEGGSEEGGVIR
ncbi:MAG: Flp pilus assembly protein CpaB [Planctomycetota bacterium]